MTGLYTEVCLPQGRGWEYLDDWTIYRGVSTPGEGGGSTWMTSMDKMAPSFLASFIFNS